MPLYDYRCEKCGTVQEIRHGFNDVVDYPCPKCGEGKLLRQFHAAPIVFKGSGYYVTDSRTANAGSKPESGESKSDGKSEPAKTEPAKAETASEAPKPQSKPEAAA